MDSLLCAGCDRPLLDRQIVHCDDRFWHQNCIRCQQCGHVQTDKMFSRDGTLLCREDYERACCTCQQCGQTIARDDLFIKIKGGHVFHQHCLTCSLCHVTLHTGDKISVTNGLITCLAHKSTSASTAGTTTTTTSTRGRRGRKKL